MSSSPTQSEPSPKAEVQEKAFTLKSILAGVLFSLLIVYLYEHNRVLGQKDFVSSYLPSFGLILVCVLSFPWNALVGRLIPFLKYSKKELVVVMAMVLVVSWIPKVMTSLGPETVMAHYKGTIDPVWKDAGVRSFLPEELLPEGSGEEPIDEVVHTGLLRSLGPDATLSDVPFDAWLGAGLQWGVILLLLMGALVSLTIIVHRQWSHHEQLRYPLASVADSLLEQDEKTGFGKLFSSPLFWMGFTPVFGALILNYLGLWYPDALPKIPTEYTLKWQTLFPLINKSGAFSISWVNISFIIIGIAYFIPSDISLSLGVTPAITVFLAAQFYLVSGTPVATGDLSILRAGGYIGFLLILIYTGRTYYLPIFLKAFGFGPKIENEAGAVHAARTFILAYVGLIFFLWVLGLDLLMGFIYISLLITMFLVVTRLVCESGMPNLLPEWAPSELMVKLIGPAGIGAGALVFIHFLGAIIASKGSATTMMPYLATTSKLTEDNGFKPNRFLTGLQLMVVLAIAVGLGATLYHLYMNGVWEHMRTPGMDSAARQLLTLKERGQFDASVAASGLGKFSMFVMDGKVTSYFLVGLLAVVATYMIRFRSSKWPFHPIMFVLVGSGTLVWTWSCFLMGWALKSLIVKFGGGTSYQRYKPVFLGLIMGEVGVAAVKSIVAMLYHASTGEIPPTR